MIFVFLDSLQHLFSNGAKFAGFRARNGKFQLREEEHSSDFPNGEPFLDRDSNQTGDALDEPEKPSHRRKTCIV